MDDRSIMASVLGPPLGERTHVSVFYRRTRHRRCNGAGPPRWNSAGLTRLIDVRRSAANRGEYRQAAGVVAARSDAS
jgi:hypothetical protein